MKTAAAIMLLTAVSFASTAGDDMLMELDADNDGLISEQEAQNDPDLAARFDELDLNQDGYLSKEELAEE